MNANPVGNSKPGIHKGKPVKANQILKPATSSAKAAALLLALNYFSTVAEAGTMPQTDGVPSQAERAQKAHGYLKVYSSTEENSPAGEADGDYFYPHTSYWIYDKSGTRIRTVENHGLYPEEGPDMVELVPGKYTVQAWSDDKGLVKLHVVIKRELTTSLHLEN